MKIETVNGKIYRKDKDSDPYYKMFLSNVCLRESCYQCPSRGLYHRADITLSDFWGVENVDEDLVDDGGLSLVIVHSEKGQKAFTEIQQFCTGREVAFDAAIKGNPLFFDSCTRPALRDSIEKDVNRLSFDKLVFKYAMGKREKIKHILKKLLKYNLV